MAAGFCFQFLSTSPQLPEIHPLWQLLSLKLNWGRYWWKTESFLSICNPFHSSSKKQGTEAVLWTLFSGSSVYFSCSLSENSCKPSNNIWKPQILKIRREIFFFHLELLGVVVFCRFFFSRHVQLCDLPFPLLRTFRNKQKPVLFSFSMSASSSFTFFALQSVFLYIKNLELLLLLHIWQFGWKILLWWTGKHWHGQHLCSSSFHCHQILSETKPWSVTIPHSSQTQ